MRTHSLVLASLIAIAAAQAAAWPNQVKTPHPIGVEGVCANGEYFQLKLEKGGTHDTKGRPVDLYTFEGPLGRGVIPSNVSPDVAKQYVCKERADRWMQDDSSIDD